MTAWLMITTDDTVLHGAGYDDDPARYYSWDNTVGLHAKPSVAIRAPHRIDHGDLTALLYLQGFRQSEFVAA